MVSQRKMVLAQQSVSLLGMEFVQGHYKPGTYIAEELLKFPEENLNCQTGSTIPWYCELSLRIYSRTVKDIHALTKMLSKDPPPWTQAQTQAILT